MVEIDRTSQYERVKLLSGLLRKQIHTDAYSDYLNLNCVTTWRQEDKIRAELKRRGYSLRAEPIFKAKFISKKDIFNSMIKSFLNK